MLFIQRERLFETKTHNRRTAFDTPGQNSLLVGGDVNGAEPSWCLISFLPSGNLPFHAGGHNFSTTLTDGAIWTRATLKNVMFCLLPNDYSFRWNCRERLLCAQTPPQPLQIFYWMLSVVITPLRTISFRTWQTKTVALAERTKLGWGGGKKKQGMGGRNGSNFWLVLRKKDYSTFSHLKSWPAQSLTWL